MTDILSTIVCINWATRVFIRGGSVFDLAAVAKVVSVYAGQLLIFFIT